MKSCFSKSSASEQRCFVSMCALFDDKKSVQSPAGSLLNTPQVSKMDTT